MQTDLPVVGVVVGVVLGWLMNRLERTLGRTYHRVSEYRVTPEKRDSDNHFKETLLAETEKLKVDYKVILGNTRLIPVTLLEPYLVMEDERGREVLSRRVMRVKGGGGEGVIIVNLAGCQFEQFTCRNDLADLPDAIGATHRLVIVARKPSGGEYRIDLGTVAQGMEKAPPAARYRAPTGRRALAQWARQRLATIRARFARPE